MVWKIVQLNSIIDMVNFQTPVSMSQHPMNLGDII